VSTLEAGVLTRLAELLGAARQATDARRLPVRHLLALAGELPGAAALTIDFSVAPRLGHPLVVLEQPRATRPPRFEALTPRERQVAACVAAGLTNRQIAARLCLSTATVKDHVHRILVKTGLPNRTAIAAAWRVAGS
jgi:DNA-binding NarL/FixJ family response regulator